MQRIGTDFIQGVTAFSLLQLQRLSHTSLMSLKKSTLRFYKYNRGIRLLQL